MLRGFAIVWVMIAAGLAYAFVEMSGPHGSGNTMAYVAMLIWFGVALVLTLAVLVMQRREDRGPGRKGG